MIELDKTDEAIFVSDCLLQTRIRNIALNIYYFELELTTQPAYKLTNSQTESIIYGELLQGNRC